MRRDRFNAPLTDAEREFAAAHHYLIAKYLREAPVANRRLV